MNIFYIFSFVAVLGLSMGFSSRVLELSDKFSEIRKDGGYWLIKFYAPWCGHCKRLEPIWVHVAQALYKTNIRVGRLDCTRYPAIASEFNVGGYPSIKFITPDNDFTFHGDRNKEDIVNFALRMAGPPVQEITRQESIANIKDLNKIFFMYVGEQNGHLWNTFYEIASKMQSKVFFYSVSKEIAKQHININDGPTVIVYKDNVYHFYPVVQSNAVTNEHLNSSLFKWINEERFETFPKLNRGNVSEVLQINKYIVLAVVEENKLLQISTKMKEFRDMIESFITSNKDKYHKYFQFGWTGTPELANNIAMQVVPLPYLLVLNSTTYHHHIPEDDPAEMTVDALDIFLERIYNQTMPAYGGNDISVRLYRTYFETSTALADMWRGNPVLTLVLFGLPLSFLSFILYSIFCADILDADEDDKDIHEKKE